MFLICPECREIILLGKNMADGWYNAPEKKDLENFYAKHEENCNILEKSFDFASEEQDNWVYGDRKEDGTNTIIYIK